MVTNAIELKNLRKHYPGFTLGPLDLAVPTGCLVGYIGENGAGKSTTLKAILNLVQADAGEVKLLGQTPGREPAFMNQVGVVFDDLHLPFDMTVAEAGHFCQLAFATWDAALFDRYLTRFKLPKKRRVKSLSRGMKMKLSLALALSHGAKLLILDEATSGLDPVVRDELLDLLLDFLQDETHTVLISSHILSDLEKAADYIAFLHEGRIHFFAPKDELKEAYALCTLTDEQAEALPAKAIVGRRRHAFGQELLVKRDCLPHGVDVVQPSIEDIMVYTIRGSEQ